ncbi:MAG: DUF4038 domain-containing protein [Planctomycetaceae bacterium]
MLRRALRSFPAFGLLIAMSAGSSAFGDAAAEFFPPHESEGDSRKPAVTVIAPVVPPDASRIVVDPANPRWLFRKDGRPFFMCGPGDPEDFLYRGKRNADGTRDGDQIAIIEKLAGTGANCLYVQAIRSHGGDGDRTHNPFIDNDPAKGLNDKVLDQWEEWFAEADRRGILMMLFLYDDSARVWRTGDELGEPERAFVHALVKRFSRFDHLIWCIAEEYQEALSPKRVSNLAAEIRAAGDKDHAIAVHKLTGTDFREFAGDPHIDQFAMQLEARDAEEMHRLVLRASTSANGRYGLNMSECAGHASRGRDEIRRMNWAAAMAGAYVMVYPLDVADTPVEQLEDCGRLVKFFERTDFHMMSPRDDLAVADATWILADLAADEAGKTATRAIVYARELKNGVGIKNFPAGDYSLTWCDCVTGAMHEIPTRKLSSAQALMIEPPAGLAGEAALFLRPAEGS